MLKYIGAALIVTGLSLFIYLFIKGRRTGIQSDIRELKMITDAGYVAERVAEEKKTSPFEGQSPIKKPKKKKRVLSEEARGILEQVEKDRGKKEVSQINPNRREEKAPLSPKKGTAVLKEQPAPQTKKGTAVLQENHMKGTETLPERRSSTDVLQEKVKNGTDVLPENARTGTEVLMQKYEEGRKKGTDVLIQSSNARDSQEIVKRSAGTAVLEEDVKGKNPVVLPDQIKERAGTAVLENATKKNGTDVLM